MDTLAMAAITEFAKGTGGDVKIEISLVES